MVDLINAIAPHAIERLNDIILSCWQTFVMTVLDGVISFIIGIVFAIILTITQKGGIKEQRIVWTVLDKIVNFFRSVPFIILIAMLVPVTRAIVHTSIGVRGAIFPLVVGTVPYFTRQIESAFAEIDKGAIEAAQSMGLGSVGIIFRVYLKESIPGIIRGTTITLISLIGLTAMAGAVGGGGLGDLAIRYGYQRYQTDITIITVVILIIFVTIIQWTGDLFAKRASH